MSDGESDVAHATFLLTKTGSFLFALFVTSHDTPAYLVTIRLARRFQTVPHNPVAL